MNVVIVGAGPSGLFAANELADQFDVTVIEERGFVGGSGLLSDGKLNFHPLIGGDLTEFLPDMEAWDLVFRIKDVFSSLGVEEKEQNRKGMEDLNIKTAKAGFRFVKILQNHIGSDYLPGVIRRFRKGLEGRFINGFIEYFTCGIELLESTIVELGEFLTDCFVKFCQAEKCVIPKGCQDPAFGHKDSGFHLGLVPGFTWACGNDGGAVVFSQVLVCGVDVRLIAAGVGHPRF